VLRRVIGGIDARRTLDVALRITIAAGLLALAALGVRELLDGVLSSSNGSQLLVVAGAGAAGTAVYAAASTALRIDEASEVAAIVRGQFKRIRIGG